MITPSWIIQKKRDGKELSREDIRSFIEGLTSGEVTDYQATAFLMAVYFQGMSLDETVALTEAMLESGDRYDLSSIPGFKVDKHSTGGIGDKVSLILAPLAAACGLKVPMMSGRGLGHTGGTLDKLESISGFRVNLSAEEFKAILQKVGCAMTGQTQRIAPADKKLYALRDVTATVECIPLIVASILSKKLAEGTNALVLDVKVGSGAFMKSRDQARKLAKMLIKVSQKMNLPCHAMLTNMNQPLGYSVGNALEVQESIEVLRNEKINDLSSTDLKELTLQLCSQMLYISGTTRKLTDARKLSAQKLADGSAWKIFTELVAAQGGNVKQLTQAGGMPRAPKKVVWKAQKKGYITQMDAEVIGKILVELGGGRKKVSDLVHPGVGLLFHKKLGSRVEEGDSIATVYAQEHTHLAPLETQFQEAIAVTKARKTVPELIFEHYTWK